mmetsp:Transcript_10584/g.20436  ORF Transcript_10584/g.20436 Transcript_10584/m.20436 type:complete len:161 (-) Transcript_10584:450-932(-)
MANKRGREGSLQNPRAGKEARTLYGKKDVFQAARGVKPVVFTSTLNPNVRTERAKSQGQGLFLKKRVHMSTSSGKDGSLDTSSNARINAKPMFSEKQMSPMQSFPPHLSEIAKTDSGLFDSMSSDRLDDWMPGLSATETCTDLIFSDSVFDPIAINNLKS